MYPFVNGANGTPLDAVTTVIPDNVGNGIGVGVGVEVEAVYDTSFDGVLSRPLALYAVTEKKYFCPATIFETSVAVVFPTAILCVYTWLVVPEYK